MIPHRILIVEDERIVAEDLKLTLISFGYDIADIVKRGESAVERARNLKPDLILMDINLAGKMNGIQAAEQIHRFSDIPVIYLTAYADEQLLQDAKITHPYGYILKPYAEREIRAAIEIALYTHDMNRKLKESEERFRTFFSSMQLGIVVIDAESHTILDINEKGLEMIGGTRETVLGSLCHRFICPAEQGRCPITDLGQTIDDSERILLTADKEKLQIQKSVISSVLHGKKVLIESFIDITPRKISEDALKNANKKLNLLSSITRHDIQNKVTIQLGLLTLARQKVKNSPEMAAFFGKLESAAQAIGSQVEFTRTYQDLDTHEPQWQDLHQTLVKTPAPPGVTVSADCAGTEIFADVMLEKVFANFFDNAVRHGGNVTKICMTAKEAGGNLLIRFRDNGTGIPENEKEKIFERGYGKNTGLGLFLVREILSITGITIRETGEPGKGARFEMWVPEGMYRITDVHREKK